MILGAKHKYGNNKCVISILIYVCVCMHTYKIYGDALQCIHLPLYLYRFRPISLDTISCNTHLL